MSLELAWGRLRRAWLRRFRPAYVQRMTGLRRGDCPACPHDIIDTRDLKYCRNVCGYWFHPQDDLFRWRESVPLARAGLAEVLWFSLLLGIPTFVCVAAGLAVHRLLWLPLIVLVPVWVFVAAFFRDPRRTIPQGRDLLLSPADGTVTHVEEVALDDFPAGKALRISIFLSVFNGHDNRVPRDSRVVSVRYFPGEYLDARSAECARRNEQLWLDLEDRHTGSPIRVKQISGAIARRIVCWLRPGEELRAGDRFGMIKFGSRTDLLIPGDLPIDLQVKVGDKVHGGSTILLRYRMSTAGEAGIPG